MKVQTGYSRLQIALHWLVALLIVHQFLFSDAIAQVWKARDMSVQPDFSLLVPLHVVGGALILLTVLWRLALRARRGAPPVEGDNSALRIIAQLTHLGLYALMLLMPISGALAWFGGVGAAAAGHNVLKLLLLALIALHVVGALYHQFVLRDGVMDRMRRPQG